ncbi:MAG: alpha-amylase family glycosyl hydrolase, partial [Clostridia bacterium]
MDIFFDSKNVCCKSPFGAVSNDQEISFKIFCKNGVFINKITIQFFNEEIEGAVMYPLDYICTRGDESEFGARLKLPKVGLYWYRFVVDTEKGIIVKNQDGFDYQLTVFDKDYTTPDDFKGGVIYHIFVDRFNKGVDNEAVFDKSGVLKDWTAPLTLVDSDGVYRANDFYGGNLQGIIDKLDYLSELGITIIYLSPIFKSSSNHRYDTGDYFDIDPLLGSQSKFKQLIDEAKCRGMLIMLDGVFNHTGADSRYFNKFGNYDSVGAFQSKSSQYYDWYTFYNFPNDYHCWWGVTVCPTISKKAKG